ncbi:hypothetical protein Droror1_Dr00021076 [Drosera rotundifolia]
MAEEMACVICAPLLLFFTFLFLISSQLSPFHYLPRQGRHRNNLREDRSSSIPTLKSRETHILFVLNFSLFGAVGLSRCLDESKTVVDLKRLGTSGFETSFLGVELIKLVDLLVAGYLDELWTGCPGC